MRKIKNNKALLLENMMKLNPDFKAKSLNEGPNFTGDYFRITTPLGSADDKLFVGVVNQGIDSHLEGFTKSKFSTENARRIFDFERSELPILLRRLEELGTDEAFQWKDDIENYDDNIDEISTGLAQKSADIASDKYLNTNRDIDPTTAYKRDVQNAKFGEYINPELKNFLMKTFADVPNFNVGRNGNDMVLRFPVDKNVAPENLESVAIVVKPDSHKILNGVIYHGNNVNYENGGLAYFPQQHLSKLPNIIKKIQADMRGEKGIFNPSKSNVMNEDEKWIQKAVDPSHKGYCTPMSKPTCTPRRKALAKRFKKGIDEATDRGKEIIYTFKIDAITGILGDPNKKQYRHPVNLIEGNPKYAPIYNGIVLSISDTPGSWYVDTLMEGDTKHSKYIYIDAGQKWACLNWSEIMDELEQWISDNGEMGAQNEGINIGSHIDDYDSYKEKVDKIKGILDNLLNNPNGSNAINGLFRLIVGGNNVGDSTNKVNKIKQTLDNILNDPEEQDDINPIYTVIAGTNRGVNRDNPVSEEYGSQGEQKRKIDLIKGKIDFLYDTKHWDIIDKVEKIIDQLFPTSEPDADLTEVMGLPKPQKQMPNDIYFNTLSEALEAATAKAEKRGYTVDNDDLWRDFGTGGVSYGENKTGHIGLLLNGQPQRKMLHITIYRMPSGKYELTSYIN